MEKISTVSKTNENKHITSDIENTWDSRTYRKWSPCSNLYITVAVRKDDPQRVEFIRVIGDGKNECGGSWYDAMSDLLTFSIRRIRNEHEARAIVKNLKFHNCNKKIANKEHISSCSDAIGRVLEEVLFGLPTKEL